jgi:hypothetical protein
LPCYSFLTDDVITFAVAGLLDPLAQRAGDLKKKALSSMGDDISRRKLTRQLALMGLLLVLTLYQFQETLSNNLKAQERKGFGTRLQRFFPNPNCFLSLILIR